MFTLHVPGLLFPSHKSLFRVETDKVTQQHSTISKVLIISKLSVLPSVDSLPGTTLQTTPNCVFCQPELLI